MSGALCAGSRAATPERGYPLSGAVGAGARQEINRATVSGAVEARAALGWICFDVGGTMVNRTETDKGPDDQAEASIRRPWHPPQFVVTDIASTDVVSNAGGDGGPMGSLS
jgi:hypothetical protein